MDKVVAAGAENIQPSISVILPVYNAVLYLKEAIESILGQTFTDFELLIYNDASTDGSDEIIRGYKDPRIIYEKIEKNAGYVVLLNKGLKIGKGKYIARMDADDIAMPTRFEKQFSFLEANPDIGICGSWYENFGDLSGLVKCPSSTGDISSSLFFGTPFGHPTIMMRKAFLIKYNLQYDNGFYATEDYDLFERASVLFDMANIPMVLLKYRKHGEQITTTKWQQQYYMVGLIQARRLLRTLLHPDNTDKNWLEKYFTEQSVPDEKWYKEIAAYKQRVLNENEIGKVYPRDILTSAVNELFAADKIKKNIYSYFFRKYYQQKKYDLQLLKSFLKEKHNPFKYFKLKHSVYFIIKCLVRYKK